MLDAARAYAVKTWSRLPNFFVTRRPGRYSTRCTLFTIDYKDYQIAGSTAQQ
jgi:hypothetical protein